MNQDIYLKITPTFLKNKISYFSSSYFYEKKLVTMVSSHAEWQKKWQGDLWKQDPSVFIGLKTTLEYFNWSRFSSEDSFIMERKKLCDIKSGATFFLRYGDHLHLVEVATTQENDHDLKNEKMILKEFVFPSISLLNRSEKKC